MSPPSHYRAIRLIIRLAARRFWNRANSQLSSGLGRKKKAGGRRRGTPGKSRGGSILLGIFVLIMLPQCIGFSARLVAKLIAVAEEAEEKPAQRKTTDSFRDAIQRSLAEHRELETGGAEGAEQGTVPRDPDARELQERVHTEIDRLGEALEKLQDQQEKGRRERSPHLMWPSEGQWPSGEPRRRLFIALALFFTLLFPAVLFTTLGSANRDLSQVEWSLEWLFTFPVPGESLFLAKILEYSFVNAVGWFFFCCPLVAIFWMAGLGWTSIPLAVGSMYFLNALVAALRITAETALRKHLSLSRIKNLQALFSVVGILLLYTVFYLALGAELPDWFAAAARGAPGALLWLPWSLPLWLAGDAAVRLAGAGLLLSLAVLIASAGSIAAARQVRDGLVKSTSPHQGTRRRAKAARPSSGLFAGIIGKEVRLLLRDRNHLVQTLVLPFLIIGFQMLINRGWFEAAARDPRHGAMTAFGFGAYVLLFGGASVLTAESKSLWMLYTFPRRIEDVLRGKVLLWAAISSCYVLGISGILGVLAREDPADLALLVGHTAMAVAGVVIYAFIAAGLGVMGANPLAEEPNRRLRPEFLYLYMLLSALFGYGIYAPQIWPKLVLLTLCALLAFAIWQKVRDRIPYLLDPTAAAPPAISLSDGLIATLMYFVLQGLLVMAFLARNARDATQLRGDQLSLASGIAGAIVILLFLYFFWRRKVEGACAFLGLRREDPSRTRWSTAIGSGIGCGAIAAMAGISYLKFVETVPVLRQYKESLRPLLAEGITAVDRWWLAGFAVLIAPVVEEFIFRGMVFRGLRRTLPVATSVLASAAIFAIVHPPISVVPVFILGVLAALSFERSRLLAAPILAHMTYNGVITALAM